MQAIRRGLCDDVTLTDDVNQACDEPTAVRGIAALTAAGVALIEQPVARRCWRALRRLAARFDVPVMADKAVHDAVNTCDLAAHGAADVYTLEILQAGGLWPTLRADVAGVGVYSGTLLEGSVGSIAAAQVEPPAPRSPEAPNSSARCCSGTTWSFRVPNTATSNCSFHKCRG